MDIILLKQRQRREVLSREALAARGDGATDEEEGTSLTPVVSSEDDTVSDSQVGKSRPPTPVPPGTLQVWVQFLPLSSSCLPFWKPWR
ncbi:hypothetical protein [Lemniscomys striatus polyomavirus 1]|nr:hypothetical protein [Lemniscomys striatus polyomavirus 1]